MLGSLILYLKGMRIMMFQLFGFYYSVCQTCGWQALRRSPKQTWVVVKIKVPFWVP